MPQRAIRELYSARKSTQWGLIEVANPKMAPGLKALVSMRGKDWVTNHVEAWHLRDDKARLDPGWFHPSSLSHVCDAYLAFQYLGMAPRPNNVEPRTLRIFDVGHNRDHAWKRYLKESGLSIVKPGNPCEKCGARNKDGRHICMPELRIRGDFDDHIRNPITGRTAIFEFKTKNTDLFGKLKAPDREHIIQVHPYMAAKGELETIIMYENKNTQDLKPFEVGFDQAIWDGIVARVLRIREQLENGWAPTRTPDAYETRCAFFDRCGSFDFSTALLMPD